MDNISQNIYEILLETIPEPAKEKQIWNQNPNRLGVCFIEFRCHEYLKKVLHNMCNIYGGTDTILYIVHGNENEEYIHNIISTWTNVQLIKMNINNIDISEYNKLLTSVDFYNKFKTEYILIFQTDTIIRKQIPAKFFKYSYVGAPWTGYPNDYPDNPHIRIGNKLVGNGGFSLRNVSRMKEICTNFKRTNMKLNEDVHISNCLDNHEVPDVEEAKEFSVEWIYYDDPVGLHQVWRFFPPQVFRKWFL